MTISSIMRAAILFIFVTLCETSSFVCDKNAVPCGCGQTAVGINARIVNGENALPNSWPMMVSLRIYRTVAMHICGGTVLDEFHILTAAHCVDPLLTDISPSDMTIAASIHNLSQPNPVIRQVNRTIIHPLWDPTFYYIQYDIAVIRLAEPLNLTDSASVTRTCLPPHSNASDGTVNDPMNNTSSVAIGWGRMNTTGSVPAILQQVTLKLIDPLDKTCASTTYDPHTQLCAGLHEGGKGACYGDSGGPIFRWIGDRWEQVGIVSYGEMGCATKGYPAVFTRVSYFVDWIESTIDNISEAAVQYNLTVQEKQLYGCYEEFFECGCGRRSVGLTSSLAVRSENALPYSWSMIVSIRRANQHVCSGTILGDSYILTSAYCLRNQGWQDITIRAGIHRLWESGATVRQVDRIYIHPNYSVNVNTRTNDIAVLHLTQPMDVKDDAYIAQTCIPSNYDPWISQIRYHVDGLQLVVAGWNITQMSNFSRVDALQQAKVVLISDETYNCSVMAEQSQHQLCAGRYDRAKGGCFAVDSGSPIFLWDGYHWIQVGLASYCASSDDLDAFTRVDIYSEWIWSIVDSNDTQRSSVYHCDKKASCGCGQTNAALTLAGAETAVVRSWPMMVSLQVYDQHVCGGTILSDLFILTAAGCANVMNRYNYTAVVAGVHRLSEVDRVVRHIAQIYIHPNYPNGGSSLHDIAIVRLDHPLPLNNRSSMLGKTCLPVVREPSRNSYLEESLPVLTIGWASLKGYGRTFDALQQIPAKLLHNTDHACSKSFMNGTYQFCVESIHDTTSTSINDLCYGDFGGPVFLFKNNHWEQIGVAPFAYSCQLYTRLSPYIGWMQNVTNSSLTTYSSPDSASDHRRHQLIVALLSLLISAVL